MTPDENEPADLTVVADVPWARTLGDAEQAVHALDEWTRLHWRTTDKRVWAACEDVGLVAGFVFRCLTEDDVAEVIRAVVRKDDAYVGAFAKIHSTIDDFRACLVAIDKAGTPDKNQAGSPDTLIENLTGLAADLRRALGEAIDAFVVVVNDRTANERGLAKARSNAMNVANDTRNQLKARRLIHEVEQARDELQNVTGNVSAEKLGAYYEKQADLDTRTADWLRKAVAGLMVLVMFCAVGVNMLLDSFSLNAVLIRLSVTIPLALLAGYLARESSRHRLSAKWACELAMALHTLPSYIGPLGSNGAELRRVLGMRVFGPGVDQSSPVGEDGLFDDLPKALDKLEEVLRRIRETIEKRESRS